MSNRKIAIVDYGMGNLFSVAGACEYAGAKAVITADAKEILGADALILPGVGAFGDAMDALRQLNLIEVLRKAADSSKPLVGICLGMQLLMTESHEFGKHQGLGIIKGSVVHFDNPVGDSGLRLKVPQVGWNRICKVKKGLDSDSWQGSMLEGLNNGEFMYFNHSFYVKPADPDISLAISSYGNVEFSSSFQYKNIFACQFHPERSGAQGLKIYNKIASFIKG